MSDENTTKRYDAIEHVVMFDADGMGPSLETVGIHAEVSPNQHSPLCRIQVIVGRHGAAGLTVAQSRELRAKLERAEADVIAAVPSLAPVVAR